MEKGRNQIQKILLLAIGVLAIILAAALVYKGYWMYQEKRREKEWEARHQEVQEEIDSVRVQIEELAKDAGALQAFLDEQVNPVLVLEERQANERSLTEGEKEAQDLLEGQEDEQDSTQEVMSGAIVIGMEETPQADPGVQSEEGGLENGEQTAAGGAIVIEAPPVSQFPVESEDTISGNDGAGENAVSGNGVEDEETVSGNGSSISGNAIVDGQTIPSVSSVSEPTLEQRRNIRSSFLETMQTNGEDRAFISNNSYDFSDIKIACLGDSLTEGSNLENLENYQQYSYPSVLKNILQAEEVYNLGIGGSSYGRYWDKAFVDRYQEIPQDVDVILVMGGTNDGFAASSKELGSLEEKQSRTFYGDVDELMRGLKRDYPNAKIIFATPLPNVLHDYLRSQRDYLLPQSVYADAVKELAAQYQIDVIDLYNSNFLDTHDAQVISTYMPDGVHGNPAGYQILAEHMARNIIEIAQRDGLGEDSVKGSEVMELEGTVSGNHLDTVSGNGNGEETVSENDSMEADGENPISGNDSNEGAGENIWGTPGIIMTPEEAKRLEEERLRAEEERMAREKEEATRVAENNKKVAENAVVIPPAQQTETKQTEPETQEGTTQGDTSNAKEAKPEKNYEYGGEAIIIQ